MSNDSKSSGGAINTPSAASAGNLLASMTSAHAAPVPSINPHTAIPQINMQQLMIQQAQPNTILFNPAQLIINPQQQQQQLQQLQQQQLMLASQPVVQNVPIAMQAQLVPQLQPSDPFSLTSSVLGINTGQLQPHVVPQMQLPMAALPSAANMVIPTQLQPQPQLQLQSQSQSQLQQQQQQIGATLGMQNFPIVSDVQKATAQQSLQTVHPPFGQQQPALVSQSFDSNLGSISSNQQALINMAAAQTFMSISPAQHQHQQQHQQQQQLLLQQQQQQQLLQTSNMQVVSPRQRPRHQISMPLLAGLDTTQAGPPSAPLFRFPELSPSHDSATAPSTKTHTLAMSALADNDNNDTNSMYASKPARFRGRSASTIAFINDDSETQEPMNIDEPLMSSQPNAADQPAPIALLPQVVTHSVVRSGSARAMIHVGVESSSASPIMPVSPVTASSVGGGSVYESVLSSARASVDTGSDVSLMSPVANRRRSKPRPSTLRTQISPYNGASSVSHTRVPTLTSLNDLFHSGQRQLHHQQIQLQQPVQQQQQQQLMISTSEIHHTPSSSVAMVMQAAGFATVDLAAVASNSLASPATPVARTAPDLNRTDCAHSSDSPELEALKKFLESNGLSSTDGSAAHSAGAHPLGTAAMLGAGGSASSSFTNIPQQQQQQQQQQHLSGTVSPTSFIERLTLNDSSFIGSRPSDLSSSASFMASLLLSSPQGTSIGGTLSSFEPATLAEVMSGNTAVSHTALLNLTAQSQHQQQQHQQQLLQQQLLQQQQQQQQQLLSPTHPFPVLPSIDSTSAILNQPSIMPVQLQPVSVPTLHPVPQRSGSLLDTIQECSIVGPTVSPPTLAPSSMSVSPAAAAQLLAAMTGGSDQTAARRSMDVNDLFLERRNRRRSELTLADRIQDEAAETIANSLSVTTPTSATTTSTLDSLSVILGVNAQRSDTSNNSTDSIMGDATLTPTSMSSASMASLAAIGKRRRSTLASVNSIGGVMSSFGNTPADSRRESNASATTPKPAHTTGQPAVHTATYVESDFVVSATPSNQPYMIVMSHSSEAELNTGQDNPSSTPSRSSKARKPRATSAKKTAESRTKSSDQSATGSATPKRKGPSMRARLPQLDSLGHHVDFNPLQAHRVPTNSDKKGDADAIDAIDAIDTIDATDPGDASGPKESGSLDVDPIDITPHPVGGRYRRVSAITGSPVRQHSKSASGIITVTYNEDALFEPTAVDDSEYVDIPDSDAPVTAKSKRDRVKEEYVCHFPDCGARFSRVYDIRRHQFGHTSQRPHVCESCGHDFSRSDALKRHQRHTESCREYFGFGEEPKTKKKSMAASGSDKPVTKRAGGGKGKGRGKGKARDDATSTTTTTTTTLASMTMDIDESAVSDDCASPALAPSAPDEHDQ